MTRTRRLAPIALVACLSLAGCLGGPTGLKVDAYETSTVRVSSWSSDANRTVTVRAGVGGNASSVVARTLAPGQTLDGTAELPCPTSGDVAVAVVDDGETVAEQTVACRTWPTVWSVHVSAAGALEIERVA